MYAFTVMMSGYKRTERYGRFMKKKSKATVTQTTAVCLAALVTVYAVTDKKEDKGEVTLVPASGFEDVLLNSNQEEKEEELNLFSLKDSEGEPIAFSGNSTGILLGSLSGQYTAAVNKVLEIGNQVRKAQIVMALPKQELGTPAAAISKTSPEMDLTQQSKAVSIADLQPFVYDKVIAKVNEYVNIRAEATTDSEIIGKLYKNSYATILERGENWTKLSSGNVTGYINNNYLYFDIEALNYARTEHALKVEITAGTVNIRKEPNTNCEILLEAKNGMSFPFYPELSTDEFFAIEYQGKTAYVTKKYSEERMTFKKAVSKEEEIKAKEAVQVKVAETKKQEEIKKSLANAKKVTVGKTNRKAISASDEEIYLLASVISSEALSESYEGKLAVANVIINRLLSGKWGDSISDVVYAKGQFVGSSTGRFEKFGKMMNEDCKKAAIEALAGVNNIGDFMFFRTKGSAKLSSYSKYYILGNHCFYQN